MWTFGVTYAATFRLQDKSDIIPFRNFDLLYCPCLYNLAVSNQNHQYILAYKLNLVYYFVGQVIFEHFSWYKEYCDNIKNI